MIWKQLIFTEEPEYEYYYEYIDTHDTTRTIFRPKQMRTKTFIVPVKDVCHVNLTFPMEDISAYYAAAPAGQGLVEQHQRSATFPRPGKLKQ